MILKAIYYLIFAGDQPIIFQLIFIEFSEGEHPCLPAVIGTFEGRPSSVNSWMMWSLVKNLKEGKNEGDW